MRTIDQSTARSIAVFMLDAADHASGKTGLTLTITASKAGAAFASISPTVTELGNGWYEVELTASHTDTLGDLALHITGAGADPNPVVVQVIEAWATSTALVVVGEDVQGITESVTALAIANAVWNEPTSGHSTAGSYGASVLVIGVPYLHTKAGGAETATATITRA